MSVPDILVFAATAVVFVVLCLGLINLVRQGPGARSRSNQLMRLRVFAQFVAILIIVAAFWWKSRGGG